MYPQATHLVIRTTCKALADTRMIHWRCTRISTYWYSILVLYRPYWNILSTLYCTFSTSRPRNKPNGIPTVKYIKGLNHACEFANVKCSTSLSAMFEYNVQYSVFNIPIVAMNNGWHTIVSEIGKSALWSSVFYFYSCRSLRRASAQSPSSSPRDRSTGVAVGSWAVNARLRIGRTAWGHVHSHEPSSRRHRVVTRVSKRAPATLDPAHAESALLRQRGAPLRSPRLLAQGLVTASSPVPSSPSASTRGDDSSIAYLLSSTTVEHPKIPQCKQFVR